MIEFVMHKGLSSKKFGSIACGGTFIDGKKFFMKVGEENGLDVTSTALAIDLSNGELTEAYNEDDWVVVVNLKCEVEP